MKIVEKWSAYFRRVYWNDLNGRAGDWRAIAAAAAAIFIPFDI